MISRELYRHRQLGWTMILSAAAPILILAVLLPHATPKAAGIVAEHIQYLWIVPAVVVTLVVLIFSSLRVVVTNEMLEISFGPGIVKRRWPIANIEAIEVTRTGVGDGWGIHRRGSRTIYNVSGFDAVSITLTEGRRIVVGTDEARQLKHAIEGARAKR